MQEKILTNEFNNDPKSIIAASISSVSIVCFSLKRFNILKYMDSWLFQGYHAATDTKQEEENQEFDEHGISLFNWQRKHFKTSKSK